MPYLKEIRLRWDRVGDRSQFPFNTPSLQGVDSIPLTRNVTFFAGENGCGKSTLLEAVASHCGFAVKGGGRGSTLGSDTDDLSLASIITLSWLPKVSRGFFLRAETLFDYADYVDELSRDPMEGEKAYIPYGGKSLHHQSHGEAFLALLMNRFHSRGIYILDEPEAALSPQRQLALLRIIWQLERDGKAQFLIATHSPILMAYPDADIYSLDESPLRKVRYEDTQHYQITKGFLNNREKMLKELFL